MLIGVACRDCGVSGHGLAAQPVSLRQDMIGGSLKHDAPDMSDPGGSISLGDISRFPQRAPMLKAASSPVSGVAARCGSCGFGTGDTSEVYTSMLAVRPLEMPACTKHLTRNKDPLLSPMVPCYWGIMLETVVHVR